MKTVIGVDIGGTKIAAFLCDAQLRPLAERTLPTPAAAKPAALAAAADKGQAQAAGRAALLADVIAICRALHAEAQAQQHRVAAIGIGTAGQVDSDSGIVVDANENLVGWRSTPVAAEVGAALGIPVAVANDVRAMAMAECALGAGAAYAHVLCLTVGTGIGGAIVLNRQVWQGAHASAGEFGYLVGEDGHPIEQIASGVALEAQYQQITRAAAIVPLREMATRAQTGDEVARAVIAEGARRLGRVLAPVVAFIDPEAVVIGGGLSELDSMWWHPLAEMLQQSPLHSVRQTPLLKAALGSRAGMMGAALLALRKLETL